jgi:hypothetical protein
MQDRPAASAPINIRISPSKIAADLNSIDSILILNEGVEETYNNCKIWGILCPNVEYLAIGKIKTLISQLKENVKKMDLDPTSDLDTIRELFEYNVTPSRILKINIDTLKLWCKYWLVPRFREYDRSNGTNTLLQLMIVIDPEVAEREKQARQDEEAAAVAEAAAAAEAADDPSDIFTGFGGKKKYLRLKRSSSSRRNKSHRKNKRRRVFRVKKSYKNKKYIK